MKKALRGIRDFLLCLILMVGGFVAIIYFGSMSAQAAEPKEVWTEVGTYDLYHYCPCKHCTGHETGITASGEPAVRFKTIACPDFEFNTLLFIEGYGFRLVQDRGIGAGKIDIFTDSHERALQYGVKKNRRVWVITGVDPEEYF